MKYFIQSLEDVEICTIRASYRSATVENGYTDLDPEDDRPLIEIYEAVPVYEIEVQGFEVRESEDF